MKRIIYLFAILFLGALGLKAQNIEDITIKRQGELMVVNLLLDLSKVYVESNRALLLTPQLIGSGDTLSLPSVGIYGRRRYYYYQREGKGMISGANELVLRNNRKSDTLSYHTTVPYNERMNGVRLFLYREEYGCCRSVLTESMSFLTEYRETVFEPFKPEFIYIRPVEETVKTRSLSGSAFIDFPVNRTEILTDYRNNRIELSKIRATIDSVRGDSDVRITLLAIKGFASPEGSYANNERLAKGRTEALCKYVNNLYHFAPGLITTAYEPENWEGLKQYVEVSGLSGRQGILSLIDSNREPDNKEWMIKSKYPEDYRYLLEHCYPALRRSDYRIEYIVRQFSDAKEIRELVKTSPQKLSLSEFYIAAQELEPGSEKFNRIFETAVHMFPEDETANLNAANSAMQREDLKNAGYYLSKAGETSEAIYARGVYAALSGDYVKAMELLHSVKESIPQAVSTLEQVKKLADEK